MLNGVMLNVRNDGSMLRVIMLCRIAECRHGDYCALN
jgi:hypothetical protein